MTRREPNLDSWYGPVSRSGNKFDPQALTRDLLRESSQRKEKAWPNLFHVIRKVADAEDALNLMPNLDPVSKNLGELAFTYFNYDRKLLSKTNANKAVDSLRDTKELYLPMNFKARVHSPVHISLYLELREVKQELLQEYEDMSLALNAGEDAFRFPSVSPRLGILRLGRYRSKREAHMASESFTRVLPETLTLSVPEVLHIPREKTRQIL